jgi:tetratricopeptide (TPR) repeat protein
MPYQPVVEALRSALSRPRFRFGIQPSWLAEASRLMPELRTLYPDLPPLTPAGPDQARARLFESLCQLILGLTVGPRPGLLCLDDLHWADSATLDWLAYLGRRLRGSRLLVIGAYRGEDADVVAGLRRGLARQGVLSELKLAGLDESAVLQLLRHLSPTLGTSHARDDKTLGGRLQQVTDGNPFFLLEMLRVLVEAGGQLDDRGSLEDIPLPDTVRDAVEARVERLSPKACQVLESGAVLGQTFAFDTVHLTAGRREMETVDGLDELVARQLLMEQTTGYRFRHEIVREAVYRGLGIWRRRLLHRRAGETLEKLQPGDAAGLAWHFERAGEPGPAARYALQAGQAAKAVFAHSEARTYFDRALALLEQEATCLGDPETVIANQRLRIQVLHDRGWALRLLGDMEAYARDLQEVAVLAESLGDQRTLAHLRYREAYTHRWFCRYAQALEAAEDGIRLSQAAADLSLEALCWREVGRAARATGDYDRARAALERALSLFVELGDAVYEVHTLGNLSTVYWRLGEHEQAMALSRRTLVRCDEAGLPFQRRLPLGDIGVAAAANGDIDLARQCLLESLTIARQIADRTQEIFCLGHLGWLRMRERELPKALEHLQAALNLAEDIDSRTEQSWLYSGLAEAHHLDGNLDQAAAHARRALDLAQASGRPYDCELARRILDRLKEG